MAFSGWLRQANGICRDGQKRLFCTHLILSTFLRDDTCYFIGTTRHYLADGWLKTRSNRTEREWNLVSGYTWWQAHCFTKYVRVSLSHHFQAPTSFSRPFHRQKRTRRRGGHESLQGGILLIQKYCNKTMSSYSRRYISRNVIC